MSENKDIQKVENDKDKIEYEKFHWEISAIKRFNICIVIIVLGIFICALFNISYKINEHNKACAKKFDSLTKDVVIDLPLIQKNRLKCYCHTFRIHNQTNRQTLFNETRRNPNSC